MTQSGLEPRDQEMIAAFIDRRLSEEERRAFMARLDEEEALYEVFVETARCRDQEAGRPAIVVEHPAGRRRWGRLAAVAAVVAVAAATPVVILNLPAARYAPQLVADGLLSDVLDDQWYAKGWPVTRGPSPGTNEFDTAFRLGVRQVDLEVALRLGRGDDAEYFAREIDRLLDSVPMAQPMQMLYAELGELAGEPERALRQAEENDTYLGDYLDEAGTVYDLGKWTEAGVLAARSGNTDLLSSRGFRRSLRGFRGADWSELDAELDEIAGLLGAPESRMDLPALAAVFTAIIDDR